MNKNYGTVTAIKTRGEGLTQTAAVVGHQRVAPMVRAVGSVYEVGTDAIDSWAAATQTITAASHAAKAGDVIYFTSGALDTLEFSVYSVDTNTIILAEQVPSAPSATDTFAIRRPISEVLTSDGFSQAVINTPTLKDLLDTPVLDAGTTTINGSGGAIVNVVASLAAACTAVVITNTTGENIGIYDDGTLVCIATKAMTEFQIGVDLAATSVIGVRNMDTGAISTTGQQLILQFLGV